MLELISLDPATGEPVATPLPTALPAVDPKTPCRLHLRGLIGADRLHIAVRTAEGDVCFRGEARVEAGDVVRIDVAPEQPEPEGPGGIRVTSPDRAIVRLALSGGCAPVPALRLPPADGEWDIAFLVDGTARIAEPPIPEPPIAEPRIAETPIEPSADRGTQTLDFSVLADLADALAETGPIPADAMRCAVLAFGDRPLSAARARDLAPRYLLQPAAEALRFEPWRADALRARLASVSATPGGDYVDAVAEGLEACRGLAWRPGARRLVVLAGDSPGFSLLHPLPAGANARVRDLDVDHQAECLHRHGVLIASLDLGAAGYPGGGDPAACDPAAGDLAAYDTDAARLRAGTAAQYARLASLPSLAFAGRDIDPRGMAAQLARTADLIGRGASLGILLDNAPEAS